MGAETVLPLRSLKTNCGLKLRLSVLAAEAETATAQAETTANRRIIFRTEAPPMHSIGASRKRFLTIFFIKGNSAGKEALYIPAGCDPAIVEKASEPRNYPNAISVATLFKRAGSARAPRDAAAVCRLRGTHIVPSLTPVRGAGPNGLRCPPRVAPHRLDHQASRYPNRERAGHT